MSGAFNRDRLPDWLAYGDSEGLTLHGRGKWRSTLCAFHDDTSPSMRVNTAGGGWCCMSCGTSGGDTLAYHMQLHGLGFIDAAKALGAWDDNGAGLVKPQRPRTLSARDGLELLYADATTLWILASDIGQGNSLTASERATAAAISRRVMIVFEGVHV